MARKQKTITITAAGRDKGKAFLITELSAAEAEEWAGRALFALMNAGVQIPDNIAKAGLAGLASVGLKALNSLKFEQAKPLFDKMMECVQLDMGRAGTRRLDDEDIEEVATRLLLRREIVALHLDFSQAAGQSISASSPGTAATTG
ncbi:hypothetical protein [Achromobacter sp. NCFB-sbj8-Ac1-l]|uniref:hypothetical protein n=1 Tax=unclassified Achromobacter TaxID=2626865 RepID=UPI004046AE0C